MTRFDKFHVHDLLIGVYLHGRCWVTILHHPGLNHPNNASADSLRLKFKYMLERNPDLIHFTPEHRKEEVARGMLIEEAQNLGCLNRLLELIGMDEDGDAGEGDISTMVGEIIESQTKQIKLIGELRKGSYSLIDIMSEILNKVTILEAMVKTKFQSDN